MPRIVGVYDLAERDGASDYLTPGRREITASAPLSEPLIEAFAMKFRTPPAIIVERLQHDKLIPFTMGNRFKRKMGPFRQRSGSTPPLATSPRP